MKIDVKRDILEDNDAQAQRNREIFGELGLLVVNVMGSPGSGKTTLIEAVIDHWQEDVKVGVIEGDLATRKDADRIAARGADVVQINTRGACHLDARMVAKVLDDIDIDNLDILFIENVGNLVCPANFDLGEDIRVVLVSTTEGADKVIKYPVIFRDAAAVVLTKIDLIEHTNFDEEEFRSDVDRVNPEMEFFRVSALKGTGLDEWCRWLEGKIKEKRGTYA